jgi:hypothetical protein
VIRLEYATYQHAGKCRCGCSVFRHAGRYIPLAEVVDVGQCMSCGCRQHEADASPAPALPTGPSSLPAAGGRGRGAEVAANLTDNAKENRR